MSNVRARPVLERVLPHSTSFAAQLHCSEGNSDSPWSQSSEPSAYAPSSVAVAGTNVASSGTYSQQNFNGTNYSSPHPFTPGGRTYASLTSSNPVSEVAPYDSVSSAGVDPPISRNGPGSYNPRGSSSALSSGTANSSQILVAKQRLMSDELRREMDTLRREMEVFREESWNGPWDPELLIAEDPPSYSS